MNSIISVYNVALFTIDRLARTNSALPRSRLSTLPTPRAFNLSLALVWDACISCNANDAGATGKRDERLVPLKERGIELL